MPSNMRNLLLLALVVLILPGCATSRHKEYSSTQPLAISESSQQDALWNATQDVLRKHRFALDRVDRAAGVITTLPVTSQHWFEVWRKDVATFRDAMESSFNPVRRWVEVTFAAGGDGAWSEVAVVVRKERLSCPDRQFNSSGSAYQYFGDSLPSTTGHYRVTMAEDRWLDQGRDPAMEDRLLRKIMIAHAKVQPAEQSAPGAEATGGKEATQQRKVLDAKEQITSGSKLVAGSDVPSL